MKRRAFFPAIAAALIAPAMIQPRVYTVFLEPTEDDCNEGGWTGQGSTIRSAMDDLRRNLESGTAEFDEYFEEVFEESTVHLEMGATTARHWDFSCPESGYEITLS